MEVLDPPRTYVITKPNKYMGFQGLYVSVFGDDFSTTLQFIKW